MNLEIIEWMNRTANGLHTYIRIISFHRETLRIVGNVGLFYCKVHLELNKSISYHVLPTFVFIQFLSLCQLFFLSIVLCVRLCM